MEQVVVLLVIAAISLVNWLIKKSAEKRAEKRLEAPESIGREDSPIPDAEEPATWQSPPDDVRKFMEALGLPTDEPAPAPRQESAWRPPAAEVIAQPPLPTPVVATFQRPRFTRPSEAARRLARRLESQQDSIRSTEIGGENRVREMLHSAQGMRDAVILSEILSKPKGLQSF